MPYFCLFLRFFCVPIFDGVFGFFCCWWYISLDINGKHLPNTFNLGPKKSICEQQQQKRRAHECSQKSNKWMITLWNRFIKCNVERDIHQIETAQTEWTNKKKNSECHDDNLCKYRDIYVSEHMMLVCFCKQEKWHIATAFKCCNRTNEECLMLIQTELWHMGLGCIRNFSKPPPPPLPSGNQDVVFLSTQTMFVRNVFAKNKNKEKQFDDSFFTNFSNPKLCMCHFVSGAWSP